MDMEPRSHGLTGGILERVGYRSTRALASKPVHGAGQSRRSASDRGVAVRKEGGARMVASGFMRSFLVVLCILFFACVGYIMFTLAHGLILLK